MKVLFVTEVNHFNYSEPLGVMLLISILKKLGHEIRLCVENERKLEQILDEWKPQVVAYSITTRGHRSCFDLNFRLKQKFPFLSVFGGPHPTFFPDCIEEKGVDVICRGEGEGAIAELAQAIDAGESLNQIPNLWVKDAEGQIHKNEVRPLIEDLDGLPFPDRELFYAIYDRPGLQNIAKFMVGRGCPFNCTYCYNNKYFKLYSGKGTRLRYRSPENVVEEAAIVLDKYPFEMAYFVDDCFPTDKEWVERFRALYKARIGRRFVCYQRVERITQEWCDAISDSGCHAICIGVETGNEVIRNEILHRYHTNEDIIAACEAMHASGIKIMASNMLGFPNETLENSLETLDLNLRIKPAHASGCILQPFPNTELYEMAVQMHIYDGDVSDVGNFHKSPDTWKLEHKEEMVRLRALFALVVVFPFLRPLVPMLLRLPLDALYQVISKVVVAYVFKFRLLPVHLGVRRFVRLMVRFALSREPG